MRGFFSPLFLPSLVAVAWRAAEPRAETVMNVYDAEGDEKWDRERDEERREEKRSDECLRCGRARKRENIIFIFRHVHLIIQSRL